MDGKRIINGSEWVGKDTEFTFIQFISDGIGETGANGQEWRTEVDFATRRRG